MEGTSFKRTLEYKKSERKRFEEYGFTAEADKVKASTYGYIVALRDAGVITERDRMFLFLYYAQS